MRALLAAAIVLLSPGLEAWTAAAANFEESGKPSPIPQIVPKVTPAPGLDGDLKLPPAPATLPDLPAQTIVTNPSAGLQDPAVSLRGPDGVPIQPQAQLQSPEAPLEQPKEGREAGLLGRLSAQEEKLEKTLEDKSEASAPPENAREAAALFEQSLIPERTSPLTVLARVTGLAPLWKTAKGKLSMQKQAGVLLDPAQPSERRVEAARRLGAAKSRETLEVLGETAAKDKDPEVRAAAREALLAAAESWTPALLKELRLHPLSGRRASAARALGWIARFFSGSEVVDALARQAAVDINQDVRLTAIHVLAQAQSPKALAALINIRRLAAKPDIISASEVAIHEAIAVQQAAGHTVAPYHPAAGEYGSSRQPLYALALKRVIAISAVFTTIEFVGGLLIGSLSLKADSMHLLADLGINVGALFALWMSRRPPNSHKTYGYLKMESLTGLLSAVAIAGMALYTLMEAVPRLWAPVAVPGLATIALACSGLLSNAISTALLYRYQEDSLSLKGAFLHAATDAVGSVGIILAGALIYFFGWFIADPLISFLIVALIIHTTWDLAKRSWNVLIDAVPPGVKIDEIEGDLLAIPGVASVYDLHVWSLNSSERALTAILFVKPNASLESALTAAKAVVREKHGVGHATLQVEYLKPPR